MARIPEPLVRKLIVKTTETADILQGAQLGGRICRVVQTYVPLSTE